MYSTSEDSKSPFYGLNNDNFEYTNKIYNYFIHPEWDEIGSETLYIKILYADYDDGVSILELIGEWNDCIANDIMFLKRDIIDKMIEEGIYKFILLCEHVFNFHGSDDCYYEEWKEDIADHEGYIVFINLLPHVLAEIKSFGIQHFVYLGNNFQDLNWRKMDPMNLITFIESKL